MKTITATFNGEDGSLGFRSGSRYKLHIECNTGKMGDVSVQSTGVLNKGQGCIYGNVIKFLENWTNIETSIPDTKRPFISREEGAKIRKEHKK